MTSRPPVLRSKLSPPSPAVELLDRPRLIDRMVSNDGPIWLVTGPAGYGKTVLAVSLIRALDLPTAWVSLDDGDNAPGRFWSHVAEALAGTGVEVELAVDALLEGRTGLAVDHLVAAVERFGQSVMLVLDDMHEVSDDRVLNDLERALARPPANLRVLLTSREALDLGVERLRVLGSLVDVGPDELAFDRSEGAEVLGAEVTDGVFTSDDVERLIDRLEGWPAGVRLAQLAARAEAKVSASMMADVDASASSIGRYLASEVVSSLPDDLRRFLLDSSILDDLDPQVCDAVTERSDSLVALRGLVDRQVFTSLVDPTGPTYRTHQVVREVLRQMVHDEPGDRATQLHDRAWRWFDAHGDLDRAIRHAVAASAHDDALRLMDEGLLEASNNGWIDDMWRWIDLIGTERVLAHRGLSSIPAWASLNQRRYDEIEPWLEAFRFAADPDDQHRQDMEIHAEAIRANRDRHLGRLDEAVRHAERAAELAAEATDSVVGPTVTATLGLHYSLVGDSRAIDVLTDALAASAAIGHTPPLVMAYAGLGLAQLDEDLDAAATSAEAALALVTNDGLERFHRPALAWYVQARCDVERGHVIEGERAAERARWIAIAGDEPAVAVLSDALLARIHHLVGRDSDARAALRLAEAAAADLVGAEWIEAEVGAARRALRFAPKLDDDQLPIGARELSERELAVLRLLPFGMTRRELAAQLFVSENTVKTHLSAIRRKVGVTGRGDVVERARSLGLIDG